MSVSKLHFGYLPGGGEVSLYTLHGAGKSCVVLTDYGAAIVEINVPDKAGQLTNVCLGYDTLEEYTANDGYLGAVCGRVANRVAGGGFELGGEFYTIECDAQGVCLHGGAAGFDKRLWSAREKGGGVEFTLVSPHGSGGYPGELRAAVTYTFSQSGALLIEYEYTSDRDTLCNLTNHVYLNLGGHDSGKIDGHLLTVNAGRVTPNSPLAVPTGAYLPVAGTPFDFTAPASLGAALERAHPQLEQALGIDINFALDGEGFRQVAALTHPPSGRRVECFTDLPGLQVYTGNHLSPRGARGGGSYAPRGGVCLETQYFPNAVNIPGFTVPLLRAGETLVTRTEYVFRAQ
jgi:aldose 1-epimerase